MTPRTHTCDELGLCQYYFGKTPCAGCQAMAVETDRRATPALDPAPLPTYAFAPGTIEGPGHAERGFFEDREPLTFNELLLLLALACLLSAALFGLAGYFVGKFA